MGDGARRRFLWDLRVADFWDFIAENLQHFFKYLQLAENRIFMIENLQLLSRFSATAPGRRKRDYKSNR